ncbi:MAG: DUF11 domain-containing protein, partial [Chloroflexi bacterium]|nr:DUF11 domain-containing protein [Chloroflexota bacterium]
LLEVGDLIRYQVTITNDTAVPMTGVIVTDTLPVGVAFVFASPTADSGPNPLVWNIGGLATDATWTTVITVEVNGTADPIGGNVASVRSDQQPDPIQTDPILPPDPGGGPGTGDVTGLLINKTAEDLDDGLLQVGDLIRYQVTITNDTAAPMTGVIVTDTLPNGVSFVSATPITYTGPNPLVWSIGGLATGATWTTVITVEVNGTADPIGGNVASVRSDQQPDPIQTDPILPPDNGTTPVQVSVQFSSAAYNVKETEGAATITVILSGTATMPVTVTYATSDETATAGSDYTAVGDTLHFDVGQTIQTFTVPVFGDTILENDETVLLTLSAPNHANLGIPSAATLTIEDNALYLPLVTSKYGQ